MGTKDHLVAVIWKRLTLIEDIAFLQAVTRNTAHNVRPLALLQVVPPSAIAPEAPARTAVAKLLKDSDDIVSCSATVYEGSGFRAAMVRSIIAGINTLARQKYPTRVFATLNEAATWIAQTHSNISPEQVHSLVDVLSEGDDFAVSRKQ
jgi:hypothetical protein